MARFRRSSKTADTPPKAAAKTASRGQAKGSARGSKADKAEGAAPQGRVAQVKAVWKLTREQDPRAIPLIIGAGLGTLVVFVVIGILIGHIVIFSILGVMLGVFAGTAVFGRRATRSMYAQVEGRPGAAAAVLQSMRGDWRVTPAVGFTRNQEMLHRVVGRAGVVLVGEGQSVPAIRQLMVDQKRRVGRVAPETPIYDVIVGDGEGQVPIPKLQQHLMKLPRNLRKSEVGALEGRLRALGTQNMPIPKGPVPTRIPRGRMR
jgi:Domain of unknown function (DUF4191)